MNAVGKPVIGIDVGGTTIKAAVVNTADGSTEFFVSVPTPSDESVNETVNTIRHIVNDIHRSYPQISALGVGLPGSFDRNRTRLHYPPNFPQWRSEPIRSLLRNALPELECIEVDNDANCAARAEAIFGAGKSYRSFILITLGTGVGGCIWTDGDVFRGEYGGAGEFGHISIDHNGSQCNCGAKGCIEAYLGRRYLLDRARSALPHLISDASEPVDITSAAIDGDEDALRFLAESGTLLGNAMATAARLLDIPVFIVAGGIAEAGELLLSSARQTLTANVFEQQKQYARVLPAWISRHSGIIGAAMLTQMASVVSKKQ